jgi:hypothetical protein
MEMTASLKIPQESKYGSVKPAIGDAGPSQSVEMSEGFEDAFAGEAIDRPKQEQVKTGMCGISEHFLELNAVTVSARLAVGSFAGDRPTLLCGELAELRELVFDFLAFVSGAYKSIDRDSRVRLQFSHRILRSRLLWLWARSIGLPCAFRLRQFFQPALPPLYVSTPVPTSHWLILAPEPMSRAAAPK